MTVMTKLTNVATTVVAEAKPLPKEVQDGLDTVLMWTKIIGGSLAVLPDGSVYRPVLRPPARPR